MRPTYEELREENDPGILAHEQLERDAPAMAKRIAKLEAVLSDIASIDHSYRAARLAREALQG